MSIPRRPSILERLLLRNQYQVLMLWKFEKTGEIRSRYATLGCQGGRLIVLPHRKSLGDKQRCRSFRGVKFAASTAKSIGLIKNAVLGSVKAPRTEVHILRARRFESHRFFEVILVCEPQRGGPIGKMHNVWRQTQPRIHSSTNIRTFLCKRTQGDS